MTEVALPAEIRSGGGSERLLNIRIGWRNLFRNRRRTWLTAGGIAFSVFLVVSTMALQAGIYATMIDSGTTLLAGHMQIQTAEYVEDSRFEDTIGDATMLMETLRARPDVAAVAPRVEAFALASAGDRSFGAQVFGIDVAAERETVRYVDMLATGRSLEGPGDTVIGTVLARNLGVVVGDEVVILGTGKEGGVAALVLTVSGLLETGIAELDRVLVLASLPEVQDGFGLTDEVHSLVIRLRDIDQVPAEVAGLRAAFLVEEPAELAVRDWVELMPELQQSIEVDRVSGRVMVGLILGLVLFSVINSFIMTVFERTREFGMLRAIGMRPLKIIAMVQWEALFVSLLGAAIGVACASLLIAWLMSTGIGLGGDLQEYTTQFYMPDRLYPAFSAGALLTAPIIMIIGTQFAAILPALRIRRLKPVDALRSE